MFSLLGDVMIYVGWGIFAFLLALSIFIYFVIKNKLAKNINQSRINIKSVDGTASLSLNIPYLYKKEVNFLEIFSTILPKDYIAYPRVGIDNMVKPYGNLVLYNAIKSKYVDICVFLKKNMQPVVAIDLIDTSLGDSTIAEQDPAVTKALKDVHIPVIVYNIKADYDKGELLEKFLDALDPISIADLKRNL